MSEANVNGHAESSAVSSNGSNGGIHFSSLFTPNHILCQTDLADRDDIIMKLLRMLALEQGIGNVQLAFDAIMENERVMPSVMTSGLAVPHARLDALNELVVGVATSKKGITYSEGIAAPVNVITLILSPKAAPGSHLQALSSLSKIFQEPDSVEKVSGLETSNEVWKFYDSGGVVLPDYVTTRDVMLPVQVKLHENDTLAHAIDLFIRHGRIDLPVVDNDDELVGVVTTYELLRVCLPDYILWMDDLTPILNFEPFSELLRNEARTWLVDIMTSDYAAVEVNKPAIQIVKELTRWRVDHAYVLDGRKLVGVVSLERFLRQIMRE